MQEKKNLFDQTLSCIEKLTSNQCIKRQQKYTTWSALSFNGLPPGSHPVPAASPSAAATHPHCDVPPGRR